MFSRCCHPGAVCRGKFWFSFHGVETLWHFQCESTVSLHSSARFIRSALRQTTHHLTWRIYHLFSAFHKLENISEPHGCGRFSSYLWRIWTTVFLREKLDLNFKMRKNIAIFWDYMTLKKVMGRESERQHTTPEWAWNWMFFTVWIKSWPYSHVTISGTVNEFIESLVLTSPQGVRIPGFPNYHISVKLGHTKKETRPISLWQSCRGLNRSASQDRAWSVLWATHHSSSLSDWPDRNRWREMWSHYEQFAFLDEI